MLGRDGSPPTPPVTAVAPALTSPSGDLSPAAPGSAAGPGRCAASGARHPPRSAKQSKPTAGGCVSAAGAPPGLPGHPHLPWLRCSRPPRPPWGQTLGSQVPLERQTAVMVLWGVSPEPPSRGCGPTGMSHARLRKPCSRSGFQAQEQLRCWRLSAALQGILETWTKARTACKAQRDGQPRSNSKQQGKTDPETS